MGELRTLATILVLAGASLAFAQNPATYVAVDAQANRHAISPDIYGLAFAATSDLVALNAPLNRSGGDSETSYNWLLNSDNRGNDWYFESFADSDATPGYRGDNFIATTRAANVSAQALLTIPMIDYIGSLGPNRSTVWSFSVAKYGAQTGWDPYNPDAGNGVGAAPGNPYITGNNPADASTPNTPSIQQGWVQHLISTWGLASAGGLKYYLMDNEPSIWFSTHRDVAPIGAGYNQIYNDYLGYAGTVRAMDPTATIVGPEEWGWLALFYSGYDQQNGTGPGSDYATHNNTYYYPWLMQQLASYQQSTGKQLLDVLSVHYYPQDGSFSDNDSLAAQLMRNRSTRSLWDPAYVDQSWIATVGIDGGIVNLIPNLKKWVKQYYPGLKTAITEYNWGDEPNLNGATTQADVLGIFGRQALDMATRWTVPVNPSPTYLAMQIYRNYDGQNSTFGNTSVFAGVADPDNLSSFAAVRSTDKALTVMVIDKQQGSTAVSVSLANFATTGTAQAWQIASATQAAITPLGNIAIANNSITVTLPSQSITLFVIPAGNVTSPPTAPAGLAATVGNGIVRLTWQAGGGATSYAVSRGAASAGPYTKVGTVLSPEPTAFKDTGLANGTTYYYVVSGANSAGAGPNSAPLAATPIAPPTFTSSASASPNPVTQGASTTVTAKVNCATHSLSNGIVQILVLDPNGNTAAGQDFTAQNFAKGQSHTYSLTLQPALAGAYTIEVGVFSSTWQQWNWNASAGTITVDSSTTFTSSATAKPSTVAIGITSNISATVTETGSAGLTNSNVELQIFSQSGSAVATTYWSGQNFAAGQSIPYSYSWTPDSSIPAGVYNVAIGVFNSGWTYDYYWNGSAATITVTQ
jgi:Glycoside hydrolase family 44